MNSRKKILLVDDSKVILTVLKKFFNNKNYNTFTASSAIEAVDILNEYEISVVITDVNMPKISGIDLLLWIKKHKPNTEVITITASANQELKDFITKNGGINFEKCSDYNVLHDIVLKQCYVKISQADISQITLYEIIQLISLSSQSKVLELQYNDKIKFAEIFFKKGQIVHAKYYDMIGEDALYNIMRVTDGIIKEQKWFNPDSYTITSTYESLFMKIAQKIDEKRFSDDEFHTIKEKKVLFLEQNYESIQDIVKLFLNNGFYIKISNLSSDFVETLQTKHFDLLVITVRFSYDDSIKLLNWVKYNCPNLKIIFMNQETNNLNNFIKEYGNIHFLDIDSSNEKILDLSIKLLSKDFFCTKLNDVSLFDFLQVLSLSGRNRNVNIVNQTASEEGIINIKKGKVLHATFIAQSGNEYEGENALFEISNLKNIVFSDSEYIEPIETTIKSNFTSIMLKTFSKDNSFHEVYEVSENQVGNKITGDYSILENAIKERDIQKLEASDFRINLGKTNISDLLKNLNGVIYTSTNNIITYESLGITIKLDDNRNIEELSVFNPVIKKNIIIN